MRHPLDRRQFLAAGTAVAAAASLTRSEASAAGPRASGRLRLASVGVGGMGASDLQSLSSHEAVDVVALCDVDDVRVAEAAAKFPGVAVFSDYREMFEKLSSQIDAVNIATPDHMHAAVTMAALQRGKHTYCQKPLTHDVYESRQLAKVARQMDLVTQMGTQVHSSREYRTAVQLVRSGVIGKIREVHSWSDKTWGYEGDAPQSVEPPPHLHWDLWLGTAPARPYAEGQYHPANWRRWCDFGCGTMGDMAIHILDPVFTALRLTAPTTIVSSSETPARQAYGLQNAVEFRFPQTEYSAGEVLVTWHDGGAMPDISGWPIETDTGTEPKETNPEPSKLPKLPGQGSMFVGEDGYILLPHVGMPMLLPADRFVDATVETIEGNNHYHLWVDACLGGAATTAGFDYAGPLTEAVLLGVLANRFPHQIMQWDPNQLRITNFEPANDWLRREYREGFETTGL